MRRVLLVCLLSAAACGGGSPSTCVPNFAVETDSGACAGVSAATLCDERFCVPADAQCGATWHVAAGASGGDGSEDRPFATLTEAAAPAEAGDCIAVAEGSYAGAVLGGGVSLYGAGAALVTIDG